MIAMSKICPDFMCYHDHLTIRISQEEFFCTIMMVNQSKIITCKVVPRYLTQDPY